MNAVRGPFTGNTASNPALHTTGCCSALSRHAARNQTIGVEHPGLETTRCESIETTLLTIILSWAGALIRMSGGRLPKQIMFENIEGAVRRGRGGDEKEWANCVRSDVRVFGIAGNWKAVALEAGVWVEKVTEGGRRLMVTCRKEEVDAARHRQEKREANETGKVVIVHRSVEPPKGRQVA